MKFWLKPREMVRHLDGSPLSQISFTALTVFAYFLFLAIFSLSLPKLSVAPLFSWKGFIAIQYVFFMIGCGVLFLIYTVTLALYLAAQSLNGQATLQQTRPAVIWSLFWSVPVAFFLLLIFLTIRGDPSPFKFWIRMGSYCGFFVMLIYAFVVLLKGISEVHRFPIWKAFLSFFLGSVFLTILSLFLRMLVY